MKVFIALLLLALPLSAQVSVKFYGAGNPAGLPAYWPKEIQAQTNPPAGFVLMTQAQLDNCIATNQPAYNAWESNKTYQAQAAKDANLARIVYLFNQIPAARTQMQQIQSTNLASVAALSVAVKAEANVLDGILEELQRLGPVLKQLYKPEDDQTQ